MAVLTAYQITHHTIRSYDPCAGFGYLFYNLSETSGPCTLPVEDVGGAHLVWFRIVHTSWSFILLLLYIARAKLNPSKSKKNNSDQHQKDQQKEITSRLSLTNAVIWFKNMDIIPKVHLVFGTPISISLVFWSLFPTPLLSSKLLTRIRLVCTGVMFASFVSACMWIATVVRVCFYFDQEGKRTAWFLTHMMVCVVWVLECTFCQLQFQGDDYTLINGTYVSLAAGVIDLSLVVTLTLNWIRVRDLRRWVWFDHCDKTVHILL